MDIIDCKNWDSLLNESVERLLRDKHVIIKCSSSSKEYDGIVVDFVYFNYDESLKKNYAGISIYTCEDKIEEISISDDMIIKIL